MISSTSQTMYRLDNLNTEQEKINYQLSTGKKIQYGSDDSNIYTREVYINDKIKIYDGIKSQIEKTSAQNNGSDSALAEAKDLVSYVKAEVIRALNDTVDDSSREVIAENLKGIKENLFDLANEQIEGEYLFSGSDSSVKPFEMDEATGKVYYTGDNELRKVVVEDGSYRDMGINGIDFMFLGTEVSATDSISFDYRDSIVDQNGDVWEIRNDVAAKTGEEIAFSAASFSLIDNKNNMWTVNTAIPQLEDDDGNTIPISQIGPTSYTAIVPSEIDEMTVNRLRKLDENGNQIPFSDLIVNEGVDGKLYTDVPSSIDSTFSIRENVFNILDNIINALEKVDANGNALTDDEAKAELQDGLTDITSSYDAMNVGHAKLGGRNHVFDISHERISAKIYQYERLQQDVSGVDLAEVAVEAKALELTYTSLYSTINRTNELSLVNFLR